MHPILFSIGNMNIYGYGTCIALGMIAAVIFATNRGKRHNVDPDLIFTAGFVGIVAGIIGAKVFYWLVELDEIIKNPKLLLNLDGSFVFYGGIIFGVLAPFIYIKL
ncbi:MAG: prolipoprotein diacylglyceryl transferase, partial [Lachnospiraceae bacterium]|nr:prolipoprotein diacylglyceryl transferase [Lachnospiraceae bacterium]